MDPSFNIPPKITGSSGARLELGPIKAKKKSTSEKQVNLLGREVGLEKQHKFKTHDINRVITILNRQKVCSLVDFKAKRVTILKDYLAQMSPEERQKDTSSKILDLMNTAYAVYTKGTNDKNDWMKRDIHSAHAGDLAVSNIYRREIEVREMETALEEAKKEPILSEKNLSKEGIEIERFENNYDELQSAELRMGNLSQTLKERVVKKPVVHVKNIVVGAGDAATEYWLDIHKESHQQTSALLEKDQNALPDVLMLASNTGNWKHDYTLAQTYSLLERGGAPSNPQDFTTTENYEENRHVNARFLYQSNLINLSNTEAPVILGSRILSVEKKDPKDKKWEVKKASSRVNIQMKLSEKPIKAPIHIDRAATNLYTQLTGKPPKDQEARTFLANLLSVSENKVQEAFSTAAISSLLAMTKTEESFAPIKQRLGLRDVSHTQFAKSLQIFLNEVVNDSLASAQNIDQATTNLYTHLTGESPKDQEDRTLLAKLLSVSENKVQEAFSTAAISSLLAMTTTEESFTPLKQRLGLKDVSHTKFAEALQIFLNEVVNDSASAQKPAKKFDQAATKFYEELAEKKQSQDHEARIFLVKLLRLATLNPTLSESQVEEAFSPKAILSFLERIKEEKPFAANKKKLGLPDTLSHEQFTKSFQTFVAETMPKKDEAYHSLRVASNMYDTPQIANGQIVLIEDKFINKQVYANQINVCAGFGEARKLTEAQLAPSFNYLTKFNPALGYTPIVDGNSFMLTAKEERAVPKNIIIYGGGGNATACYRKSFFRHDTHLEDRKYKKDNQFAKNITWFSRDGFELAGYGNLAKTAISFANQNDQLCCGDLVKVEEAPNGKIKLYFKDLAGTYERKPITYSTKMDSEHPRKTIQDPNDSHKKILVREFECDQFVYTIGQEGQPVRDVFDEFEKEYEVFQDDASSMPLGVRTKDSSIQFWGATASVVSPSKEAKVEVRQADIDKLRAEYQTAQQAALEATKKASTPEAQAEAAYQTTRSQMLKFRIDEAESRKFITEDKTSKGIREWASEFNDRLRDWIVIQRIARDAEWPGVMPPSRVSSRQAAFASNNRLMNELQARQDQLKADSQAKNDKIQQLKHQGESLKDGSVKNNELHNRVKQLEQENIEVQKEIEQIESKMRGAQSEFSHANANLDDIEYINGFLVKAGVDDKITRLGFLTALLEVRQTAYHNNHFHGIANKEVDELLAKFKINDRIIREGHCTLAIRKKKA